MFNKINHMNINPSHKTGIPGASGISTINLFAGMMLFICSLSGCIASSCLADQPLIVKDGYPHADIVISAQPSRAAKLAAKELQDYLGKISGAKLPIVTAPGTNISAHIFVGQSIYIDRMKIADDDLKYGAFRMLTVTNGLVLLGHDSDFIPPQPAYAKDFADRARATQEWDALTGEHWNLPNFLVYKSYNKELDIWDYDERGSLNAVYEFLYDLGVRWFMPGELGEIVPALKTISLPDVNKIVRPVFPLRHFRSFAGQFNTAPSEHVLWRLRLRGHMGHDLVGLNRVSHGTCRVHGREEIKKTHPEYYMLRGGQRDTYLGISGRDGRPCLSSEGLFAQNVKYARAIFDIYKEPMISVMPGDGYMSLCGCELCKGKDTPERGSQGLLSDYVWGYVNRVAAELYKTHPDRKVICLAYGSYFLPPDKIDKLSPNVVVGICQWRSLLNDPEKKKQLLDVRQAWVNKTSNKLFIYEYYRLSEPGRNFEGVPAFFPHIIAEDLHALEKISMGEVVEATSDVKNRNAWHAPGFNHLDIYLTARLYWDTDQDVDLLLDDYYQKYYGPAAADMKAFIEYCEAHWFNVSTQPDTIAKMFELLSATRQSAGNTVYGQRIDLIRDYMQPLHKLHLRLIGGRQNAKKAKAIPIKDESITMDGKIVETDFWGKINGFYMLSDLQDGNTPGNSTVFNARWRIKENALYLAIQCNESDMKALNAISTNQAESTLLDGDFVSVLLETQDHAYYEIAVNPTGAVYDADHKDGINPLWSSGAKTAVHQDNKSWSVEICIPIGDQINGGADSLSIVEGRRPTPLHPWYFNICRQRVRNGKIEHSAFAPTGTNTFYIPSKFAELVVGW